MGGSYPRFVDDVLRSHLGFRVGMPMCAYLDRKNALIRRLRVKVGNKEKLECEITVLRDTLRRAQWHLGVDVQSSAPTKEETEEFLAEVRAVLKGD